MFRCPHCFFEGGVERTRALRWRCGACGCPVVPVDGMILPSHTELASLVAAQRARAIAVAWGGAAWVLGSASVMGGGLSVLLRRASGLATCVLAFVAFVLAALSAVSARNGARRAAEASGRLDEAWRRVAGQIVAARARSMTACELADAMSTDAQHAGDLLARLAATDAVPAPAGERDESERADGLDKGRAAPA